jgi:hypothetical protein
MTYFDCLNRDVLSLLEPYLAHYEIEENLKFKDSKIDGTIIITNGTTIIEQWLYLNDLSKSAREFITSNFFDLTDCYDYSDYFRYDKKDSYFELVVRKENSWTSVTFPRQLNSHIRRWIYKICSERLDDKILVNQLKRYLDTYDHF